jgi:hypothetical protein
MWRWLLVVFALGCGEATPAQPKTGSNWHPSTGDEASRLTIRIEESSWKDAATKIIGDMCSDAVLVWGDLVVDESVRPRAVELAFDGGKIDGFLVCGSSIEAFLKMQTANPRFKAGHGGSGDLKWREGQLHLRRRWSAADIALGQLDPPPEGVFQHGESLAGIVAIEDPSPKVGPMLSALSRAPRVFVFAMLPLR